MMSISSIAVVFLAAAGLSTAYPASGDLASQPPNGNFADNPPHGNFVDNPPGKGGFATKPDRSPLVGHFAAYPNNIEKNKLADGPPIGEFTAK